MTYVCRKLMNVLSAESGEVEQRMPGQEVPEAASWPNLQHYLHLGWVEDVQPAHQTYPQLPDLIEENVDKDSSAGLRRSRRRVERQEAERAEVERLRAQLVELESKTES